MKKSFINVENAQCLLIPLRSVGFKGSSDCSSNDVILSCKDLTCTLRSLLPSSFWIEELYKAPGILDGGFISFCLRIQGWVMFNHALTEGWTTENAFKIDLIFPAHPLPPLYFMTSPLSAGKQHDGARLQEMRQVWKWKVVLVLNLVLVVKSKRPYWRDGKPS